MRVVLFFIVTLFFINMVQAEPTPLALFKGVEAERMKYEPIQVNFTTEYINDEDFGTITISSLVETAQGMRRFEDFPAENADVFPGSVNILKDEEVYAYQRKAGNTVGNGVRYCDLKEAVRRADFVYDPRILGLVDIPSANKTVKHCMCYEIYTEQSLVGRETINDTNVWHVRCTQTGLATADFWIEEPSFRVHRQQIETLEAGKLKVVIDSKFDSKSVGPFPSEFHIQRFENNKQVFNRIVHITKIVHGKPIPPERFTLASMNLPLNTDVIDYRIHRRIGFWDGEKLVEKPVKMLVQEQREWEEKSKQQSSKQQPLGIGRYVFIISGLLLMVVAIILMIRKRFR
ncbi:MAG: outer membrane lipoprotein-sorting protein [Planctomycetaceae bacterium]|nr:outer membrane lipoprotein-sorting protein [Planctomycetaceae bacterium]